MNIERRKTAFVQLGKIFENLVSKNEWPGYDLGINEKEYETLQNTISKMFVYNGWFTEANVLKSLDSWAKALTEENLNSWISKYSFNEDVSKTVGLIMAGNVPLVGFHDFLSVLISGHKVKLKLSSDDNVLFPKILEILFHLDEDFKNDVNLVVGKLEGIDAVIATGSDNSSRYFEAYFGKYPNIIRKNRTSIAVITGEETKEDMVALGADIFDHFGLGCRNVSKIFIPKDFDLNKVFEGLYEYRNIINHNKYANNYDYNKAVYLMNKIELVENGFVLLKEDKGLHSPLAVLFYERYDDKKEVDDFVKENESKIQCIVGKEYIPFGKAQEPELWDYADKVDTLKFLTSL